MAEKNSSDNQKSKKKYKWFTIILIILLLLLIGVVGYYLEKDLIEIPGNSPITEKEEKSSNRPADKIETNNGETADKIKTNNGETADKIKTNNGETADKIKTNNGETADKIEKNQTDKDQLQNVENFAKRDNKFSEELSDPSILDRVLSILGLSEIDFSQRLNILFVGLDDEKSVTVGTIEADSIMLGKLRPEKNKLEIKNINENTIYKNKELRKYYDGDLKEAVEIITASKIDHYVYVNYKGFEEVIDELGGIQINLKEKIEVPALNLDLKTGNNLLSGKEALNFVRWNGNNSSDRFLRQKLLIHSIIDKLQANNLSFKAEDLYHIIVESYSSIKTDINPVLAAEIFNYIKEDDDFSLEFID